MYLDKDIYKYKQVYSRISSYKNSLITVKAYFNNPDLVEADAMAKIPRMGDVYKAYVDKCFKAGAMDFDDLLLKTNELLTRFPDVLAKYSGIPVGSPAAVPRCWGDMKDPQHSALCRHSLSVFQ